MENETSIISVVICNSNTFFMITKKTNLDYSSMDGLNAEANRVFATGLIFEVDINEE